MVKKRGPLPQPKKGPNFTIRQKKLLQELPTSKTITEAAIKAGYGPKNAGQLGSQALQRMRGRVPDLMERVGLSEEFLIEKHLKPLLSATETKFVREDERVRVGRKIEVRSIVNKYMLADNAARLNALDKAFLLHGSYAPRDPKEAAQFGVKVIIQDIRGVPRPPIDIKPGMAIPELPTDTSNGAKPAVPENSKRPADKLGHD
jgi:hypothetical protein